MMGVKPFQSYPKYCQMCPFQLQNSNNISATQKKAMSIRVKIHPCLSTANESLFQDEMFENIVYNSYYQWVPLYLTFLAFFFYLPRYIWLKMEGGLMKLFRKGTTAR